MQSDPSMWDDMYLPPECWHLEEVVWKRRSKLSEILKRRRAGDDVHVAVHAGAPELAAHVDRFWNEFIPRLQATDRSTWDSMPDLVDELRARYGKADLHALERLLGRYAFMLAEGLDPLFFDAGFAPIFSLGKPTLDVKAYMQLAMLMHLVICDGRDSFERVLAQPSAASEWVPKLTTANGLFCTALFRFEMFVFEAQKTRLLQNVIEPKRVQFSLSSAELTARFDEIAKRLFGVVDPYNFVREQFRGPRFEKGHPEQYPTFRLDPSGVVVRDDQPPG
jgi:hypothetical protein